MIGSYDPRQENVAKKVTLKQDRFAHWVKNVALPSETVATLVKRLNKKVAA